MPGHPALVFPERKSELYQLCEVMRNHHNAMSQQDRAIVAALRPALSQISTGRPLLGADAKVNAYRVCRQLVFAASLNLETARAYVRAKDLYEDLFATVGRAPRKFDPDH